MAMAHSQSSLFKPTSPHQPVAMLMLIENSLAMSQIWVDLRDQHLDRIVETATAVNGTTSPITVSVLESYPCQDHGANPSHPRQYSGNLDGLRDVKFNPNPDNQISIGRINSCIDFLDSFKFQGQPAALHLIIVAATPPSDDSNETCVSPGEYSPWIFLAKKMAERSIHCHIVVSPQNATGSLTTLFEETLRMQANVEEQLYPPVDPSRIILRLSAKPTYQIQQPYSDPVLAVSNLYSSPERLPPSLPRRSSYPAAESPYSDAFATPSPTDGEPPSLVSQLQQVHGLTKKKVYGAKPVRQPFFREERIRDKYNKAPTLTMPLPIVDPTVTAGGKAISHSRADRMARVGQPSPTESHSRRQHGWPRRGSRLSTPESENNMAWSPSPSAYHDTSPGSTYVSSMSSDISSPVTPVTTMEDIYHGLPKTIPSTASTAIHGMAPLMNVYQTGGMPEPSWPQQQQQGQPPYVDGYSGVPQSYFPPMVPPPQYYSNTGELVQQSNPQAPPPEQAAQPPVQSSLPPAPYASYATEQRLIVRPQVASTLIPTSNSPSTNTSTASAAPDSTIAVARGSARGAAPKRRPSQEDEERFTFSQDFVDATAALFEAEVLPAYPNYPGMSSGLSTRSGTQAAAAPPAPGAQTGELYASRIRSIFPPPAGGPSGHPHPASVHSTTANPMAGRASYSSYSAPAYPPPYGSSLTGWAG